MKLTKLSFLFAFCLSLLFAFSIFAQGDTFSDPNVNYTFDLPDDDWKLTSKPSNLSPNVEFVHENRRGGHLEVRKLLIKSGETIEDQIREEETKLQFKPGFVTGKLENFKGFLSGKVYNFEFVRSGRNMSGRYYFLKADENTIYLLRFEGYRENLLSLRNETDLMARTFNVETKMEK